VISIILERERERNAYRRTRRARKEKNIILFILTKYERKQIEQKGYNIKEKGTQQ